MLISYVMNQKNINSPQRQIHLLLNGVTDKLSVRGGSILYGMAKGKGKGIRNPLVNHHLASVWQTMRYRCKTTKGGAAEKYHDRGIRVCEEWQVFINFYNWSIANGYEEGLTIDRINNDGNYEPSNCRWTTWSVQNSNKRKYQSMPRH